MATLVSDEIASVRERFFASLIDVLLLAPLFVVLVTYTGYASIILSPVLGLVYHWYCWTHFTGQTPGKKIINIRIIRSNGSELNHQGAVVRYLVCCLSLVTFGFSWLMLLSNLPRQALHDSVADTVVIKNY